MGVGVDPASDVYVVTPYAVSKFTNSGTLITWWGSEASANYASEFGTAWKVAVDSSGNVYVTDNANDRT